MADDRTPKGGWLDAREQRAWLAYIRLQLRLTYEINRQLQADSDLSLADWDVLTALGAATGNTMTITALAAQIGWERSRLSHQVKRMSGRGTLSLRPAEADRRVTEVALTEAGQSVLTQAAPGHVDLVRGLFFDGLPDDLLEPLSAALENVYAHVLAHGSLPGPETP
jgi:DNA-binding MarR family transcriptional regulator